MEGKTKTILIVVGCVLAVALVVFLLWKLKKKSESKIDYGTPIAIATPIVPCNNDGIFPGYLRKQYFETTD
ncbi:MAG: hypothetical protein E7077_00065 [Bacteroidales bacterium]|nr:hypothetical protein [Bacteroidales bacterium]